ncbi:MAG: HlyD family efflux transporter periplasmic adaptor subunit [Terrimicrobiaceae bacterium]
MEQVSAMSMTEHQPLPTPSSPLASEEFATPPTGLRKVIPPGWMRNGLIGVVMLTLLCGGGVLISPMDEFVIAPGEVRPADFLFIFSRSDGILESVLVEDGANVVPGQVLAKLDPWENTKLVEEIQGQIEQAKAELALHEAAERKVTAAPVPPEFLFSALEVERQQEVQGIQQDYLRRLKQLESSGAAAGTELLSVRLQLIASEALLKRSQQANDLFTGSYGAAAREEAQSRKAVAAASLRSLESRLAAAKTDLDRLQISAPQAGTILSTASRFPGEKVAAGEALFKISSTTSTELRLYATEDRVNLIQPGQLVRFRANNNPDRLAPLATGRVLDVALDRELEQQQEPQDPRSPYRITVAVEKAPYPLAVGATVQAEILIARKPFWRVLAMKTSADQADF